MKTSVLSKTILGYVLGLCLVGLAVVPSELTRPIVTYWFLAAVVVTAWIGGRGPGLLAASIAPFVLAYFFFPPLYTLGIGKEARPYVVPFLLCALAAAWMGSTRRKAQIAEAESVRLATAVQQATQGVVITDTDGRIKYVNRAFSVMTGYAADEVLGQTPRILKSDQQDRKFYSELWSTILAGRPWRGELLNRRKDGTLYIDEMTITPVRNAAGKLTDFIALKRDVTGERSKAALLEAQLNSTIDGILVVDTEGRRILHNRRLVELFRIPPEVLLDTNDAPMLQHVIGLVSDPEPFLTRIKQLYSQPRITSRDQIELKDGTILDRYSAPVVDQREKSYGRISIFRDITERKRAEDAVRESEERFRLMADGCPSILWVTDAEGEVRFANCATREFFGAKQEELEGSNWKQVGHPEGARHYIEEFQSSVQKQCIFKAEGRFRRADGEWRMLGSFAKPRFSASGEFLGHIGLSGDITDRLTAEQDLKDSEEKFRQLAENIREVFWMMNAAGTEILYVGPAYEQIWGRTCASLCENPMDWMEAIHPDDRELAHAAFIRQMQGEHIESEYRIRTPDGVLKWVLDRASPVRDQDGQITRVVGIAEDITERKRAEQALRQREQEARERLAELEQVYKYAPVGLCLRDKELRYLRINERLAAFNGHPIEQTIGRSVHEICQTLQIE